MALPATLFSLLPSLLVLLGWKGRRVKTSGGGEEKNWSFVGCGRRKRRGKRKGGIGFCFQLERTVDGRKRRKEEKGWRLLNLGGWREPSFPSEKKPSPLLDASYRQQDDLESIPK